MSDKYAHGENSKLTVGASGEISGSGTVDLCITKFEWEEQYDEHDVTSTCSNGFYEGQLGIKRITFTLEAKLDLTEKPWVSIVNGNTGSVAWFALATGSPNVSIPTALFTNVKVTGAVNDVITYSITGKSTGSYTLA